MRRATMVGVFSMTLGMACGPKVPAGEKHPLDTFHPPARQTKVVETHFGTTVEDPYRWMETDSVEFRSWLSKENSLARSVLDRLPARKFFASEIEAAVAKVGGSISDVQEADGKLFFLRRGRDEESYVLWVRAKDGSERRLLDLNKGPKNHQSIDFFLASPQGRRVLFGVAEGGAQEYQLRILDTTSGEILSEVGPVERYLRAAWLNDSEFLYSDYLMRHPNKGNGRAIYHHTVGTDFGQDAYVFGPSTSPVPFVPDPLPEVVANSKSSLAAMVVSSGVLDPYLVVVKPKGQLLDPKSPWIVAAKPEDGIDSITLHGDCLYLLSHREASQRRVLRRCMISGGLSLPEEIIQESGVTIQRVYAANDALYAIDLMGGMSGVRRFDWDGHPLPIPKLPEVGEVDAESGAVSAFADTDGVYVRLESVTHPATWLRFDPTGNAWEAIERGKEGKASRGSFVTESLVVTSKDGTRVPMEVYHRSDLVLDGRNPTLIQVYGSYGLPMLPGFFAPRLAWLQKGGILAYAHVRGGGEFGQAWHNAGRAMNKQNAANDFLACAEELIRKRYTSPANLGVHSASAGAIVASMGVLQRPSLFAAATFGSGMLDTLRFEQSPSGVANAAEFGSTKVESEWKGLLAMDAVAHVQPGQSYPPMLFSVGANDPIVPNWQSGKMVAKLQDADRTRGPILLRVDFEDGHGTGSTAASENERYADYYAFSWTALNGSPSWSTEK